MTIYWAEQALSDCSQVRELLVDLPKVGLNTEVAEVIFHETFSRRRKRPLCIL